MSDLQCPATLLVALHGEATSAGPEIGGVRADRYGPLTGRGRQQVSHLVEQVRPRRVAAVYSSGVGQAVESAARAASELGLRHIVVDEIGDDEVHDLARGRFRDALEAVADVHRGETVLVFVHGEVLAWVPGISVNGRNTAVTPDPLPFCVAAEVEVDSDGWRLVSWPSTT
jgi:2,3-bisphosphoglycerate-dependent phosphoglycerate mutase